MLSPAVCVGERQAGRVGTDKIAGLKLTVEEKAPVVAEDVDPRQLCAQEA